GLEARFSGVVGVLEAVSISAVVWVGNWLVGRHGLSVGTLVFFIILIQNMFKPTRKIIKQWATIGKLRASAERVAEVLARQPSVHDLPGATEAPPLRGELEFRHVSFAYRPDPEDGAGATPADAHEFIERMPERYDTELSERATNLSGGQRQRIAIARALVRKAPILILDEPTTGLDAESSRVVLQALRRLMKGKTTIIISHDL